MADRDRIQIIAKSLYRSLLSQGFDKKDVIVLASELLEQLLSEERTDMVDGLLEAPGDRPLGG